MDLHEKGPCDSEEDWQVLIKKAEKFELIELQKILVNREQLLILEKLLDDAFVISRPKPSEYEHRKQVIRVLNDIAKDLYGNSASSPVVEEFGSFLMDLFTTDSDLDLSINFPNSSLVFPRDQKIKTLRMFSKKLYSLQSAGRVQQVEPVMGAKVPILKFVDTVTGVECDISVENRDGISKSLIIRLIASIDERFQKLCFLMKTWAKAHDINSPKDRTLNSVSIILLVAFHLQTRDPPILPPFSAILKDGADSASIENSVRNFKNYGRRNTETLSELFVSFLIKLASVEKLWPKGLCASPYLGRWTFKTWNNKVAIMSVEDFVNQTENVARAVGNFEVKKIYDCIHLTIENFGLFMNVKIEEIKLKESFFGIDGIKKEKIRLEPKLNVKKEKYKKNHLLTTNRKLTKNKDSNSVDPKLDAQKEEHEKNHLVTKSPKLTLNEVSNTVEPKLNAGKEEHQNNHLMSQNLKLTLNNISNAVEPKLNARKEKYENNHMTQNPKFTINKVSNAVEPKLKSHRTQNPELTLDKVSNPKPKLNARKEKHKKNRDMTQNPELTLNKVSDPAEPKLDNHMTQNPELTLNKVSNAVKPRLNTRKEKHKKNQVMTQNPELTLNKVSDHVEPKLTLNKASNPIKPKLKARKEKHKKNHVMTQNPKLTLNKVSNPVEPKLNIGKEKHKKNNVMTQNPELIMNVSNPPLSIGHRGVPQHQPVTAGPTIPWANQSFYHQPRMGNGPAEGMPATQWWRPAWGGPGWTQGWSGATSGSWVGPNGPAFMDPWGRRLQQHPYGNSSNTCGPSLR